MARWNAAIDPAMPNRRASRALGNIAPMLEEIRDAMSKRDQYDAMRLANDMPCASSRPTSNVLWLRTPIDRLCAVGESSISS